jgi:hypothetical protein
MAGRADALFINQSPKTMAACSGKHGSMSRTGNTANNALSHEISDENDVGRLIDRGDRVQSGEDPSWRTNSENNRYPMIHLPARM